MAAILTAKDLKALGFKPTIFIIEGFYHEKTDILIQLATHGPNGPNKQLTDGLQRIDTKRAATIQEAKEVIQELELQEFPEKPSMSESYILNKKTRKLRKKFRQTSPNFSNRPNR
jgi:hypothetical protein